jgi:hypothetical protein
MAFSIGSVFSILSLISTLIVPLKAIIQAAEEAFPETGQGPSKYKMVMDSVGATLEAAGKSVDEITAASGPIGKVVNSIVAIFNATGAFKKS